MALVTLFYACATRFGTNACALEPRRRFLTEHKGKETIITKPNYQLKLSTAFPLEIPSKKIGHHFTKAISVISYF